MKVFTWIVTHLEDYVDSCRTASYVINDLVQKNQGIDWPLRDFFLHKVEVKEELHERTPQHGPYERSRKDYLFSWSHVIYHWPLILYHERQEPKKFWRLIRHHAEVNQRLSICSQVVRNQLRLFLWKLENRRCSYLPRWQWTFLSFLKSSFNESSELGNWILHAKRFFCKLRFKRSLPERKEETQPLQSGDGE